MAYSTFYIREVAKYLKIKEKTAYKLAFEGKIFGFMLDGWLCSYRAGIANWVGQQKQKHGGVE